MINFELSSEQMRLWVESQRNPNSSLLHIQYLYQFTHRLDVAWFKYCVNFILKNEPIFNTVFKVVDGIPKGYLSQIEYKEVEYIELSKFDFLKNQKEEVVFLEQESKKPINLLQRPNYRIKLYRSKHANIYYFSCILPHILIDAYSCDILFSRLAEFYNNKKTLITYHCNDFLGKKPLYSVEDRLSKSYWKEKLSNKQLNLDLEKLFTINKEVSNNELNICCEYDELEYSYYKAVKALSRKLKTTPFLVFISIYAFVLYRYTGQAVFSILYPLNIRDINQKNTLGYYVNLLPLQFDFKKNTTLSSLIKDITKQRKDDKFHQQYPYSSICKLARKDSNDLFNVLFSRTRLTVNFELDNVDIEFIPSKYGHAGYDFSLLYDVDQTGCVFSFEYNANKYPSWLVKQILNTINFCISNINENINKNLHAHPVMNKKDMAKLLAMTVTENFNFKKNKESVLDKLNYFALSNPNKIALINNDFTLTYRELEEQSNKIATNLIALGIKQHNRVALLFETKHYYVLTIVALVKINITFIPVDRFTPYDRMHHILTDSNSDYLICEDKIAHHYDDFEINKIFIESALKQPSNDSIIKSKYNDEDIIYVIYTSGTTGKPKGVPIRYSSINNLFSICDNYFNFTNNDIWSLSHSFAFDFSVWEMWGSIYHGATLLLVPDNIKKDPFEFYTYLTYNKVTICNITPTAFKNFFVADRKLKNKLTLRYIIFGGEKLLFSDVKPWLEQHGENTPTLINMYGLTEAPIHATYHKICLNDEIYGDSIIGKPLQDIKIYIVDHYGNILPEGVYGEIWLSSNFMTSGYLNLNKENKSKFIQNTFDLETTNVYKTGDYACWLPNGALNYLGRTDQQIQLNGFRVELSEISYVLQQISLVDNAVSIVYEHSDHRKSIVTFCVGDAGDDTKACIFNYLKKRLPFYMIPADIIFVAKIPLTQQGKVDIAQLKHLASQLNNTKATVKKSHDMIQAVSNIWRELLDVSNIDIDRNYFDYGGDSISLLRLHSLLERLINDSINFNELFYYTTIRTQADYLSERLCVKKPNNSNEHKKTRRHSLNSSDDLANKIEDIAIIGMSGRFPGAASLDDFWENLRIGKESITSFSEKELEDKGSGSGVNKEYIRAKGYLSEADCFDANFFNYSKHEAIMLDPQHRVLLEAAWSALEDAGYISEEQAGKTGVFVGQSNLGSYYYKYLLGNVGRHGSSSIYQALIQNSPDFLATRIAYKFNLTGPAMTIQTGCSTSLVAICQAAQSLLDSQCEMAIAGGVSITFPIKSGYEYEEGMIFSDDGHCRPFDEKAGGTVPGNGVGVVILKRYSDAIAAKDNIYAVIKGYALNNDGGHKVGFTAPSVIGQADVIGTALQNANVAPDTIDYVETHGTGTILGDPIEIEALHTVLRTSEQNNGYKIGSVKSNIGHLDAASGVVGLIKTVLCLYHRVLVPTINFNQINPKISAITRSFDVVTKTQEWKTNHPLRRAGVSAFAIGGTNAHIILEEHNPQSANKKTTNRFYLFILSAKTNDALKVSHQELIKYLEKSSDNTTLCNVAYTLQIGRKHFNHRVYYMARDKQSLLSQLKENRDNSKEFYSNDNKKICFMFSGQGLKKINDISNLYSEYPIFKEQVLRCISILLDKQGIDLRNLFFLDDNKKIYSLENFDEFNQLYIFITEYALARQWIDWGIQPTGMIGHSLGEYVAACLSGVWSLEDTLFIVTKRQQLLNKLAMGSMLAVSMSVENIQKYLINSLEISAINSPERCTVSGTVKDIKWLNKKLQEKAISCQFLSVNSAYHSIAVESVQDEFESFLKEILFKNPTISFISNVSGKWITNAEATSPRYWSTHMRSTVLFSSGINILQHDQFSFFIELGFSNHLSTFVRQHKIKAQAYAPYFHGLRNNTIQMNLEVIGTLWKNGFSIDWSAFNKQSVGSRISLPSYPFQRERYWIKKNSQALDQTNHIKTNIPKIYQPNWRQQSIQGLPSIEKEIVYIIFHSSTEYENILIKKLQTISSNVYLFSHKIAEFEKIINDPRKEFLDKIDKAPSINIIYFYPSSNNLELMIGEQNRSYHNFESYLLMIKTIIAQKFNSIKLNVITKELFHISDDDKINPLDSLVLGPALTIHRELSNVTHTIIDIPRIDKPTYINTYADRCIQEIQSHHDEKIVAFRRGKRLVRDFINVSFPKKSDWQPQENGSYIISGGLGHIGLVFADFLSKIAKVKISILTRRPFPSKEEWPAYLSENKNKEEVEIIKQLYKIINRQSDISIFQVDIGNYKYLDRIIQVIRKKYGKINGIIHTAGVSDGNILSKLEIGSIHTVLPAKVSGALNLHQLTLNDNLDFMLFCSALSAISGAYGQSLYNSANGFLDAFAVWRNRHYGNTISVNWDTWLDGGMAKELIKHFHINTGLTDKQAQEKLADIFSYQGSQLVVASSELEERLTENILNNSDEDKDFSSIATPFKNDSQLNAIKQRLTDLWIQYLGCVNPTEQDDFHLLGGDSLLAVQFASILADEYRIRIYPHVLIKHSTIKKLGEFIYGKLDELKRNEIYQNDNNFCLVKLTDISSEKPNVFLIHPVGGTVNIYHDIAKRLERIANVYGIQAMALDGKSNPVISVETMATSYIEYLKNVQPEGEYMLGGASFGGLIAYEMAQQLYKKESLVNLLFLLDTPSPEHYPKELPTDSEIIQYMLEVGAQHTIDHSFGKLSLTEQLDYFLKYAGGLGESLPQFNHEHLKLYLSIYKYNIEAMFAYKLQSPCQTSLKAYYFRALERDRINPEHPESGWKKIFENKLTIKEISGNHITMLLSPHVNEVGEALTKLIHKNVEKLQEETIYNEIIDNY